MDPTDVLDFPQLISRCRLGDDLAWETLVRRLQGRIYSLSYHYLRNREEAHDCAQDIFIRVYRKLHTLDESRPFFPWLLRLARNCCVDRLRRLEVRSRHLAHDDEDLTEVAARTPTPEESYVQATRDHTVHQALGQLSQVNREMILLKEIQGLKMEEIADLLAVPIGTVKSRSNRARIELGKALYALQAAQGVPG